MQGKHPEKKGFTLVEVLVVVVIMGILSAMGVAGLRQAVMNNRVKDAALNTAAFLERIATEANRISAKVCVKKVTDQTLGAFTSEDCDNPNPADMKWSLDIDYPNKFGCDNTDDLPGDDWTDGVWFIPKLGLSAAPAEGYVCVQYSGEDLYGAAVKLKTVNSVSPRWKIGDSWDNL